MINFAGRKDYENLDIDCRAELEQAGIEVVDFGKFGFKNEEQHAEVQTNIVGTLHGWEFKRAWYYWVCNGPGIPLKEATQLHEVHGQVVRVAGHGGCPSPLEWYKGLGVGNYHVDTQEGLNALATTIKKIVESATPTHKVPWLNEDNK